MRIRLFTAVATVGLVLATLLTGQSANAVSLVATVSGTLTIDGTPTPGIRVGWFDPNYGIDGGSSTTTAADGSYSFIASGEYLTDGYLVYAGLVPTDSGWDPADSSTYLGAFIGTNGADYLYQERIGFTGADGNPTVNIDLEKPGSIEVTDSRFARSTFALTNLNDTVLANVTATASGILRFGGLIPGRYRIQQDFSAVDGLAAWRSDEIVVSADTVTQVGATVVPTGTISGLVTTKGKPVGGVSIYASSDSKYGGTAKTNSAGRFVIANIAAGDYQLSFDVYGKNSKNILPATKSVTVASGQIVPIAIGVKTGGSISGSVKPTGKAAFDLSVVDAAGVIVASDSVTAKSSSKPTKFSFTAIKPGRVTVYVSTTNRKKYAAKSITIRSGKTSKTGILASTKKTISVSGKVASSRSGIVYVVSSDYRLNYRHSAVKNGRYSISGIIPGRASKILLLEYGRLDKSYVLPSGSTKKKNLVVGSEPGNVDATPTAGLHRYFGTGSLTNVKTGTRDATWAVYFDLLNTTGVRAGSYKIELDSDNSRFVSGSPFWLSLPALGPIDVRTGATTHLGALALTINR